LQEPRRYTVQASSSGSQSIEYPKCVHFCYETDLANDGMFRRGCSIIAVGRDISVVFVEHFSGKTVDLVTVVISCTTQHFSHFGPSAFARSIIFVFVGKLR